MDQYNNLYGLETLHPLGKALSTLRKAELGAVKSNTNALWRFTLLFLKLAKDFAILSMAVSLYDYQVRYVLSVLSPGQTISVSTVGDQISQPVYGLVFHPDLIHGTSLGKTIKNYTFFSYAVHEALHLSDQEKETVMDCLKKISIELEHPIDKHSKALIAMNIELLLNYCMRFYERQFITRSNANKDALTKFEQLLDEYFQSGLPMQEGLPSVKYFRRQDLSFSQLLW